MVFQAGNYDSQAVDHLSMDPFVEPLHVAGSLEGESL